MPKKIFMNLKLHKSVANCKNSNFCGRNSSFYKGINTIYFYGSLKLITSQPFSKKRKDNFVPKSLHTTTYAKMDMLLTFSIFVT